MAPLQRRNTNLSIQGTVAVIILVVMFLGGIFCTIIFFKLCSKQRRRERAMRRMQEESAPFVTAQNTAPLGAPSDGNTPPYAEQTNGPTELHTAEYKSTAPLELQGEGRLEPLPAQQLDGYMAAPTIDNSSPIELPANALVGKTGDNGHGVLAVEDPQQEKKSAFARMHALFK